jgi:hypothetical protein
MVEGSDVRTQFNRILYVLPPIESGRSCADSPVFAANRCIVDLASVPQKFGQIILLLLVSIKRCLRIDYDCLGSTWTRWQRGVHLVVRTLSRTPGVRNALSAGLLLPSICSIGMAYTESISGQNSCPRESTLVVSKSCRSMWSYWIRILYLAPSRSRLSPRCHHDPQLLSVVRIIVLFDRGALRQIE